MPCNLCRSDDQNENERAEAQRQSNEIDQKFRSMWPKPIDITVGLLKAEGHYVTHIAYGLTILLVKKAEGNNYKCNGEDGVEETSITHNITLNENILFMQVMHIISFFLIGYAIYLDSTDLNAH